MLRHDTLPDVVDALANLLCGHDPQLASRKLLHEHCLSTHAPETSDTVERREALEERLDRTRDLYELGDLTRPEYIARREAINTELTSLTPEPLPSLDQASKVLEDFTIFWAAETDPNAKRQFLSHVFGGVWLDRDRIVAVQPKPSFLPFFSDQRPRTAAEAGVNDGNDGESSPRLIPRGLRSGCEVCARDVNKPLGRPKRLICLLDDES